MKNLKLYHKQFILVISCIAFFTACKKNHVGPVNPCDPNSANTQIIKYGDDNSNLQFVYNSAGKVDKVTYVANSLPTVYNISYTNSDLLQMQTANSITKLTLANGLLQKAELYNNNGADLQNTTVFNYVNGRLSEQVITYAQGAPGLKYQYNYAATGDVSTITLLLWDVITNQYKLSHTFQCEYDDHPNPLTPVNNFYILFYAVPASPHNLTKVTAYDEHGSITLTATYVYSYNNNGYPSTAVRTFVQPGTVPQISHIQYNYQ